MDNYNPAVRTDCGPGGCGPTGWASNQGLGTPKEIAESVPGLSKYTIDILLNKPLMYRIVSLLIKDCLRKLPKLIGKDEELTKVITYLEQLDFFGEALVAMYYARAYGGGAVLLFVEDGKRNDEELDLSQVRRIRGFYALPKWYVTPLDNGSSRIDRGWYGQRIGRPEMYNVTPLVTATGTGPDNLAQALRDGGNRWHRSRIIPWQYRDEMDLIQSRLYQNFNGWGPGIVEAVLPAFANRENGILKFADIINGSHFNVLSLANSVQAQATPSGGATLAATLQGIKQCMAATGSDLPLVGIPTGATLKAEFHNLSGLADAVDAQRKWLLDVVEYPEVVLFSSGGSSGLQDSAAKGQWQAYHSLVAGMQETWVWKGGRLGGGILQAVKLAMGAMDGPTNGEVMEIEEVIWPALEVASEKDRAEARLKNAQARSLDAVILGSTGQSVAILDPTVSEAYPALDVDDGILPSFENGMVGQDLPTAEEAATSTTPVSAAKNVAGAPGDQATQDAALTPVVPAVPKPPVVLPTDIETEAQIAGALRMTKLAFRRWVATVPGITTYPMPAGMRGGNRYSLGEVMNAWNSAAKMSRTDAAALGLAPLWDAINTPQSKRGARVQERKFFKDAQEESKQEADAWLDARSGEEPATITEEARNLWVAATNVRSDSFRGQPLSGEGSRITTKLLTLPQEAWTLGAARNGVWAAKMVNRLLTLPASAERDTELLKWGYDSRM